MPIITIKIYLNFQFRLHSCDDQPLNNLVGADRSCYPDLVVGRKGLTVWPIFKVYPITLLCAIWASLQVQQDFMDLVGCCPIVVGCMIPSIQPSLDTMPVRVNTILDNRSSVGSSGVIEIYRVFCFTIIVSAPHVELLSREWKLFILCLLVHLSRQQYSADAYDSL